MSTRVRRLGFGAALATGLSLLGLSVGGMASLDADLRAAAEQRPSIERVVVTDHGRDCPFEKRVSARET
ncbi:MAG: hypothetical protein M3389_09370 [Actinomycetota bacterium]|nr:hypothetical protein [Actinomycetota bacterium]